MFIVVFIDEPVVAALMTQNALTASGPEYVVSVITFNTAITQSMSEQLLGSRVAGLLCRAKGHCDYHCNAKAVAI